MVYIVGNASFVSAMNSSNIRRMPLRRRKKAAINEFLKFFRNLDFKSKVEVLNEFTLIYP